MLPRQTKRTLTGRPAEGLEAMVVLFCWECWEGREGLVVRERERERESGVIDRAGPVHHILRHTFFCRNSKHAASRLENSSSSLEYLPDLLDSLQISCDRPGCPALHPSGSQCPLPLATNASNDRSGPVRISVARRQLHILTATGLSALSAENAAGYKKKRRVVQGMGRRAGSGGGWPSDGRSVEREARPMGHRTGFWGFGGVGHRQADSAGIRTHASSWWPVLSAESETETAI
jgi:hypothetical protein